MIHTVSTSTLDLWGELTVKVLTLCDFGGLKFWGAQLLRSGHTGCHLNAQRINSSRWSLYLPIVTCSIHRIQGLKVKSVIETLMGPKLANYLDPSKY